MVSCAKAILSEYLKYGTTWKKQQSALDATEKILLQVRNSDVHLLAMKIYAQHASVDHVVALFQDLQSDATLGTFPMHYRVLLFA